MVRVSLIKRRLFNMHMKNKFVLLIVLTLSCALLLFTLSRKAEVDQNERTLQLRKIDELIRNEASSSACQQPELPVFSREMMKFVRDAPPIDCSQAERDWVYCKGFECRIDTEVIAKYGNIKCSFTDIIRVDDFESRDGETIWSNTHYKLEHSDVVRVWCRSADGHQWSSTLTGIRYAPDIWQNATWSTLPTASPHLNILIFGLDSMSRNSFVRKLPQTYKYLTKVLHADILRGYNIIGDGTPQALIPILTGRTELELPDTRKRYKNTRTVDVYPFVWNEYKKAGYVTAFYEDVPELSTFTYRLNGFQKPPTDHYMRPYYLASLKERHRWPKLCTGHRARHQVMLDHIADFFTVYNTKPKFLFGFHGELSHDDYNLIGAADDDLREFFQQLHRTKTLDDTLLIVMADHGHRFAEIRNTVQGKLEERLPFFAFRLPEKFKKYHQNAYANFRSNLDKLTTPFDVHETLLDVLKLDHPDVADLSKRAVSLFSKIPPHRSCAHAYIEPHWCACLDWIDVPSTDPLIPRMVETFLNTLNQYTEEYRHICDILTLDRIEWVKKVEPNRNLLQYKKNSDQDGFVPDLSAKMTVHSRMYQVKVVLKPGGGIFEATVSHQLDTDEFRLRISDISRVNMYKDQATCVERDFPHLRKYCHCK